MPNFPIEAAPGVGAHGPIAGTGLTGHPQFVDNALDQALFARGGDDLPGMLKLQMEGKIDSWSIRFDYAHHRNKALCLYPVRSKIQNIGFDGSGVRCGVSEDYIVELDPGRQGLRLRPDLQLDSAIINVFNGRFRAPRGFELLYRAAKKERAG